MQVYRGMDIGTAKPTREERSAVPHHLIDIADITEAFSVADFIEKARKASIDITSRGNIPVIAGGTGLYIDMLLSGKTLADTKADDTLRIELYEKAEKEGAKALHEYLEKLDPVSAAAIHPNNIKRVVRAIEIYLTSGRTKTEQDQHSRLTDSIYDYKVIYLDCSDRKLLYDRINSRVDKMLEQGLEKEASILYRSGLRDTPTASQAIGYKEFFPYFEQDYSLKEAVDEIKRNTRRYAKRQKTYFNRIPNAFMLDIATESVDGIYCKALDFIRSEGIAKGGA